MTKLTKFLMLVCVSLLIASCGGPNADAIVGKWKVDMTTLDIVLGDNVPAEQKAQFEGMKGMYSAMATSEANKITFEFTKEGKLLISGGADNEEMDYAINGSTLNLKGEADGKKFDVKIGLPELSAEKMTLKITGEEVIAQVKASDATMLEKAKGSGFDLEKMAVGTYAAISFKK